MEARRILILTASYGGGHRAVSSAIEAYYRDYSDAEVRVIDLLDVAAPQLNVLAKFAYQRSESFFPTMTGSFSQLEEAFPDSQVVQEVKASGLGHLGSIIDDWAPHAVVSVCPLAAGIAAEVKANRAFLAVSVSLDYRGESSWIHPSTDIHFVPCKETREDLVVRGIPWDRIVVSGIPVSKSFSEPCSRTDALSEFGLLDRFTVLFTPTTGTPADIREIVKRLLDQGVQVAVVAGHNDRLRHSLEALGESNRFLRVFGYVEDMPSMMCAADLFVGRAGGPGLPEALASGLPLIIMGPVPGQVLPNVDFIANYGAGLYARDGDDVVEKVKFLSSHVERLAQMATDARLMGRSNAVHTVCERVAAAVR